MAATSTKQISGTDTDLVEFGRLLRMLWTIHFGAAPTFSMRYQIGSIIRAAYTAGSTPLKTISMSCSGKASLDTPIRLLAH
jgi:hypothetical protein